jgi:hypothetical protein
MKTIATFLCYSVLIALAHSPALARPAQTLPGEDNQKQSPALLQVEHYFLEKSGYLSVVYQGTKVIKVQYYAPSQSVPSQVRKKAIYQGYGRSTVQGATTPPVKVIIDNEIIIVIRFTFPDGSVTYVVIHKATGVTTVIENPSSAG